MARTNAERQAAMANKNTSTDAETGDTPTVAADTAQSDAPLNEHATTSVDEPTKAAKSIVPSKYAGKYKNGGSDELAQFIKSVCGEGDKFEYSAFFALCRANIGGSLTEEKIAHYEAEVASKKQGANGRARMTLRNMLAPIARKEGGLKNLAGEKVEFTLAKPAVSGAAAEAKAAAGEPAQTDNSAAGTDAGSDPASEQTGSEETQTE